MNTLAPIPGAPPSTLTHTIPSHVNGHPVLCFIADHEYVLCDPRTPSGYVLVDLGNEFVTWHAFRNSNGGWDADTGHYHSYAGPTVVDPNKRKAAYVAALLDLEQRA